MQKSVFAAFQDPDHHEISTFTKKLLYRSKFIVVQEEESLCLLCYTSPDYLAWHSCITSRQTTYGLLLLSLNRAAIQGNVHSRFKEGSGTPLQCSSWLEHYMQLYTVCMVPQTMSTPFPGNRLSSSKDKEQLLH